MRVVSDTLSSDLRRIAAQMSNPRQLIAGVGKEAEIQFRKHFRARDKEGNKRGFPRKHFWEREVARNTALTSVTSTTATITVASPAFVHKVFGGLITAKRGGALSIPISPEAYAIGSASLFPRPLTQVNRKGGRPPLLVETGTIGESTAWTIHYVLVKSVDQAPDARAMPDAAALESSLRTRALGILRRVLRV